MSSFASQTAVPYAVMPYAEKHCPHEQMHETPLMILLKLICGLSWSFIYLAVGVFANKFLLERATSLTKNFVEGIVADEEEEERRKTSGPPRRPVTIPVSQRGNQRTRAGKAGSSSGQQQDELQQPLVVEEEEGVGTEVHVPPGSGAGEGEEEGEEMTPRRTHKLSAIKAERNAAPTTAPVIEQAQPDDDHSPERGSGTTTNNAATRDSSLSSSSERSSTGTSDLTVISTSTEERKHKKRKVLVVSKVRTHGVAVLLKAAAMPSLWTDGVVQFYAVVVIFCLCSAVVLFEQTLLTTDSFVVRVECFSGLTFNTLVEVMLAVMAYGMSFTLLLTLYQVTDFVAHRHAVACKRRDRKLYIAFVVVMLVFIVLSYQPNDIDRVPAMARTVGMYLDVAISATVALTSVFIGVYVPSKIRRFVSPRKRKMIRVVSAALCICFLIRMLYEIPQHGRRGFDLAIKGVVLNIGESRTQQALFMQLLINFLPMSLSLVILRQMKDNRST